MQCQHIVSISNVMYAVNTSTNIQKLPIIIGTYNASIPEPFLL